MSTDNVQFKSYNNIIIVACMVDTLSRGHSMALQMFSFFALKQQRQHLGAHELNKYSHAAMAMASEYELPYA